MLKMERRKGPVITGAKRYLSGKPGKEVDIGL